MGTGGGGISERVSGDTDEFSSGEVSVEAAGIGRKAEFPFSSTSVRTWETMAGLGPVFLRWGFTMGELRILALPLGFAGAFFLGFFDRSTDPIAAVVEVSSSISMGELFE